MMAPPATHRGLYGISNREAKRWTEKLIAVGVTMILRMKRKAMTCLPTWGVSFREFLTPLSKIWRGRRSPDDADVALSPRGGVLDDR